MLAYERRSNEHTKLIAELTQKVEMQTDQLEHLREKLRIAQDETRSMQAKTEVLERKLSDSDQQNRELIGVISKKEEALYQTQQRQEDLRAENIRLNQQLESSVLEARRQVDSQKEKALVKVSRTLRQWRFDAEGFVTKIGGNDKMSTCLHGEKKTRGILFLTMPHNRVTAYTKPQRACS